MIKVIQHVMIMLLGRFILGKYMKGFYWKDMVVFRIKSTTMDKNYGKTAKNGVVLDTTSNVKLFLETIWSG